MPLHTVISAALRNGKALVAQVLFVDQGLQHVAGIRTGNGEPRPGVADRHHVQVELRPQHLMAIFQMLHHRPGLAGGRGDEEAVLAQPGHRAVVEDHAVVPQHQAVARAPDRQLGEAVRVDPVDQLDRVRALDLDLAERRDIAEARPVAHAVDLARDRFLEAFPVFREVVPAHPHAGLDEPRAVLRGPVMERGAPDRPVGGPARMARQGTEADRQIGRAEGRGADIRDRLCRARPQAPQGR